VAWGGSSAVSSTMSSLREGVAGPGARPRPGLLPSAWRSIRGMDTARAPPVVATPACGGDLRARRVPRRASAGRGSCGAVRSVPQRRRRAPRRSRGTGRCPGGSTALHQRPDPRAIRADDQVALPVAWDRTAVGLGRALADHDVVDQVPARALPGPGTRYPQRRSGPQPGHPGRGGPPATGSKMVSFTAWLHRSSSRFVTSDSSSASAPCRREPGSRRRARRTTRSAERADVEVERAHAAREQSSQPARHLGGGPSVEVSPRTTVGRPPQ
jgi:hypothetical protein